MALEYLQSEKNDKEGKDDEEEIKESDKKEDKA